MALSLAPKTWGSFKSKCTRNSKSGPDFPLNPETCPFPRPQTPGNSPWLGSRSATVSGADHGEARSAALCWECPHGVPRIAFQNWARLLGLPHDFYRPHTSNAVKTKEVNQGRATLHQNHSLPSAKRGPPVLTFEGPVLKLTLNSSVLKYKLLKKRESGGRRFAEYFSLRVNSGI